MIITVIGQPPTVTSPGTFPQVSSMPILVEGPPQAFREALQDIPHAIQIPYPEDPLARSLMKPNADVYYVCYTPMPVYFCLINGYFRLETPDCFHNVHTLQEVWDLAKAL